MTCESKPPWIECSFSARDDGTLEAAYIRFAFGDVAKTVEIVEDVLLVDYDENGEMLGIEILAPVRLKDITELVAPRQRSPVRKVFEERANDLLVA